MKETFFPRLLSSPAQLNPSPMFRLYHFFFFGSSVFRKVVAVVSDSCRHIGFAESNFFLMARGPISRWREVEKRRFMDDRARYVALIMTDALTRADQSSSFSPGYTSSLTQFSHLPSTVAMRFVSFRVGASCLCMRSCEKEGDRTVTRPLCCATVCICSHACPAPADARVQITCPSIIQSRLAASALNPPFLFHHLLNPQHSRL